MLVSIATSGGLLGTGAGQPAKEIDTALLAEPLRAAVCEAFSAKSLDALSHKAAEGADRYVYHVTVTGEDGRKHRYDIPEAVLPPHMLDLIDEF